MRLLVRYDVRNEVGKASSICWGMLMAPAGGANHCLALCVQNKQLEDDAKNKEERLAAKAKEEKVAAKKVQALMAVLTSTT